MLHQCLLLRQYDDQISNLLNLEQKYDKYVVGVKENAKNKYSYSQFAIALRYKDTLQLSPTQSATLLSYVDTLKQLKNQYYKDNKKGLDTRAYESQHIATVLSNNQYTQVLLFKNRTKAEPLAENDWREVEQRGLNTTYEKTKTVTELTNYYLVRECTSNKFQHDLIRQKAELREVFSHLMQAIEWFEKSAKSGYGAAWTELGKFYKYGLGKQKNYTQAYEYFAQASKLEHPTGIYSHGYMLYKGFGVAQNYEAAVQVFKKGVAFNSPGSMYMLGLCYRNGFGIEMNLDSARTLLLRAQKLGNPLSTGELLAENAEYNPKNALLSANISEATNIATQSDFSIDTYTPIANAVKAEDLNNEYKGYVIKYAWSGTKIIEAVELELSLYTPDSTTFGIWGEKGRRHKLLINATCRDSSIVFNNNNYRRRRDHYHAHRPLINRFQTANLKRIDKGENSYLIYEMPYKATYCKKHHISFCKGLIFLPIFLILNT